MQELLQFGHGFTAVDIFRPRRTARAVGLLQFGHGFTAVDIVTLAKQSGNAIELQFGHGFTAVDMTVASMSGTCGCRAIA